MDEPTMNRHCYRVIFNKTLARLV
ncbi:MAG: hypothetical protein D8B60_08840, partial [Moraxella sp.]